MFDLENNSNVSRLPQRGKKWEADAFLNLHLPAGTETGRKKVGAIPLRVENKGEAQLIELLKTNPEALPDIIAKMVEVARPEDFQLADGSGGSEFDLGDITGTAEEAQTG